MDRDRDLNKKFEDDEKGINRNQDEITRQIYATLAMGSASLGLNYAESIDDSEKRLKDDLKR